MYVKGSLLQVSTLVGSLVPKLTESQILREQVHAADVSVHIAEAGEGDLSGGSGTTVVRFPSEVSGITALSSVAKSPIKVRHQEQQQQQQHNEQQQPVGQKEKSLPPPEEEIPAAVTAAATPGKRGSHVLAAVTPQKPFTPLKRSNRYGTYRI